MHGVNLPFFDLEAKTLGIFGTLDREVCLAATEVILRLNNSPSRGPLHLYLGCNGGHQEDVILVLDCLRARRGPLHTYAMSQVKGVGVLLFAEGNKRLGLPHASLSLEGVRPQRGFGCSYDLYNSVRDDEANSWISVLSDQVGAETLAALLENREVTMTQARELGLVHRMVSSRKPARILTHGGRTRSS